jgi:tetrahydromethanopterin S-methyltransferase subunit G
MQTVVEEREMPMELYDEKFKRVNERFDEVNRRITEGREETKQRFDRVEGDIAELKGTVNRILIGLILGFLTLFGTVLAVLGTVLAKGA